MGLTIFFAIIVSVIAMVVIALSAFMTYRLMSRLQIKENDFQQQLNDLCAAIVISNLMSSESGLDRRLALFERAYQGKIPISVRSRKDIN
jgi:hypothetical protein